jgi:hypothetical protein
MKKPNWANCSEKELWEFVASHLAKNGIQTILVGGAVTLAPRSKQLMLPIYF